MSTQLCQVFLGDHIDDRNERHFLQRVRVDLERRGCAARIYANFITRRSQRQVDFLISTAHRLCHVELKTVDPGLPLVVGVNGLWAQELPGGQLRSLERNFYRQAHTTTYAISDDMHGLARGGDVPRPAGKFYTNIHTVICVLPRIPAGSQLDAYQHVEVVDYGELLDLLCSDGPRPAWSDEHWSAFIRHLQLFPEPIDSTEEAERRVSLAAVEDYRRRFVAAHSHDLPVFVPIAARHGDVSVLNPADFLAEAVFGQRTVVLLGPSGAGKSHTAQHAAVAVAEAGGVPVWVRCGEYQRGRLSHALARAVAPFTTEGCLPLLRRAADAGAPAVVVLDGFNECVPADRGLLLEQLDALQLRLPVAAIITSTVPVGQPATDIVTLNALLPDNKAREALLSAYGRHSGLAGVEAFQTPMELAMAAECGESIRPGAASTELFDAYVARLCPVERTRAALRCLAAEMDRNMRGSLSVAEVRVTLHRGPAASSSPDADIDEVLSSQLLSPTQGRVAFRHELFARFLIAEQLVLDSADSEALAEALRDFRHTDLQTHAVALEPDADRRLGLLLALADVGLLCAAVRGEFGTSTARAVTAEVAATLAQATADISDASLAHEEGTPDGFLALYWTTDAPRSRLQQVLLGVAGGCLADGVLLDEVGVLLDASDRRCAQEMRRLRADGYRTAISAVVRATYSRLRYSDERELRTLPAAIVVNACEHNWMRASPLPGRSPTQALWESSGEHRWGRLTAALLLANPDDPADLALLPELVSAAWKANGVHLRLTALTTAHQLSHCADELTRERMRTVLEECDKDNVWLNGLLFEALAAYDGLEPLTTEETIHAEIAEILAAPTDPQACDAAQHMVGMIFEDQRLHGPYGEVISALDDADALRLHVMAARSGGFPHNRDWIMAAIVDHLDHADNDARDVLRAAVVNLDWDHPFREEAVRGHVIALYGWARLADELPPAPPAAGKTARQAWRMADELLFAAFRGADPEAGELTGLWIELQARWAPAAVDVLAHLRSASSWGPRTVDPSPYQRLLTTWPDQMRQLLEWCAQYGDQVVATFDNGPAYHARGHLVADLADLGTERTAALLEPHITDPDIGATVVETIRAIKRRTDKHRSG